MDKPSDALLLFLGELAMEHTKRPDRWNQFLKTCDTHGFSLSKQEFAELDSHVAGFVKFWKFYFTDIKQDFYRRTYNCPYAMVWNGNKEAREWYLAQVEAGVAPNGPTFISYLREYIEGTSHHFSPVFRFGPPPKGMVLTKSAEKKRSKTDESRSKTDSGSSIFSSTTFWGWLIALALFGWALNSDLKREPDSPCVFNHATGECIPKGVYERRRESNDQQLKNLQDEIYRNR